MSILGLTLCNILVYQLAIYSFGQMNVERLMKMAGAVRTGGKGSMRRYVYYLEFP